MMTLGLLKIISQIFDIRPRVPNPFDKLSGDVNSRYRLLMLLLHRTSLNKVLSFIGQNIGLFYASVNWLLAAILNVTADHLVEKNVTTPTFWPIGRRQYLPESLGMRPQAVYNIRSILSHHQKVRQTKGLFRPA